MPTIDDKIAASEAIEEKLLDQLLVLPDSTIYDGPDNVLDLLNGQGAITDMLRRVRDRAQARAILAPQPAATNWRGNGIQLNDATPVD